MTVNATVAELAERLGASALNMCRGEERVTCGYAGDLLSRVMAHAGKGCAWVTIMSSVNVAAVAELIGASCVILAEGVQPDAEFLEAAGKRKLNLLSCKQDAFELCRLIASVSDARTPEHGDRDE